MKHTGRTFAFLGAFALTLTAAGQQSGGEGGQGAQSQACVAYASTTGSSMTGGMMTGGAMTGGMMTGGMMTGGMSGGTSLQPDQVQGAVQSALACLSELRADIQAGQNAEQSALALFNIREDLSRVFEAAQMVEESNESLVQLEALQLAVSEQREEAVTSLDQVTESLSALSTSNTGSGGSQ